MRSFWTISLVMLGFLTGLGTGRYIMPSAPSESSVTRPSQTPGANVTKKTPQKILEIRPKSSQSPECLPSHERVLDTRREIDPELDPNHPKNRMPREIQLPTMAEELQKQESKREMATSLREQGVPELEIQRIVEGAFPPPPKLEDQYSPYELSASEKSPEELKAELAASLKEAGVPPEQIQQHVESIFSSQPEKEVPPPPQHPE